MASVTYYAVMPFVRDEDGNLCPDEAVECQSPGGAASRARALAVTKAGAVAFSRTGDPDIGDFSDAVIIAKVGDVPPDLEAVTGA